MRLMLLLTMFALFGPSLEAPKREDLVLIDGRYLHVKILSPSDKGIQVQLLDTGGQVFLPWGLIDEPYRSDIMKRFGLGAQEETKVILEEGDRINGKLGDSWEGRIASETETDVTLKHRGKIMSFPKTSIRDIERKVDVNALDIYSPEEYYQKRAAELKVPDDDIPGNMELGQLASDIGLYEKAHDHYKRVQTADPGYEKEKVENILKRLEELAKNQQISAALTEAKNTMSYNNFPKALQQFDALLALPTIPESLKGEVQIWKDRCLKKRYEYLRVQVRTLYENKTYEKIRTMSRDEKIKLQDAQKRLRSDLHKEVVGEVASALSIDGKEVEKMWEDRQFGQPRMASYGSGSFIVLGKSPDADKYEAELSKYLAQAQQKQNQNQGKSSKNTNSQGSLSPQNDKLPKPPTKDEWWTKVSQSSDREQWMRAYWAENSKRVTVVGDRWEECPRCGGAGALQFSGTQGDTLRTTCPSCQGHKRYKGVAYK